MDENIQSVRQAILDAVERRYGNIHPTRLAWDLSRQLHVPAYVVSSTCMDLIKEGKLATQHGKIRGKANMPSFRQVPILQSTQQKEGPGEEQQEGSNHASDRGRWGFFRELVEYYIQCLRLEEKTSVQIWQSSLGEKFLFITDAGRWFPRDNILWQKTFPYEEISGALKDLWRDPETTTITLGYPVCAKVGKEGILLCPVFCYTLDQQLGKKGLMVRARMTKPVINTEWLKGAFRGNEAKRTFLEACGMFCTAEEDTAENEEEYGYLSSEDSLDFSSLAQVVASACEQSICEPLDPCCLKSHPITQSSKSGIYNRAIIMAGPCNKYHKRLISELQTIKKSTDATLDRTALVHIFAEEEPCPEYSRLTPGAVAAELPLTETQCRAVSSLLERPLTIIQGPPGTGKSQVVSTTVLNAVLHKQSVLVSGYNHKAIDAIVDRLGASQEAGSLIVRCNSKEDPNLSFGMRQALKKMLQLPSSSESKDNEHFLNLLAARGEKGLEIEDIEQLGTELGQTELEIDLLVAAMPFLDDFSYRSANDILLYQNATKFARQCTNKTALQTFLPHLNIGALYCLWRAGKELRKGNLSAPQYSWNLNIQEVAEAFDAASKFIQLDEQSSRLIETLKTKPDLEELNQELIEQSIQIKNSLSAAKKLEENNSKMLPPGITRPEVKALERSLAALKNTLTHSDIRSTLYAELPEKLPVVLHAFPCWAVTSLSVGRFIPLVPGMFDLVLIDEASQSNIPSAIPLLFRAKRAGVIGDPQQLRFVTRMNEDREALLQRELKMTSSMDLRFTFSENSFYDLASSSDIATPFLLDRTFRSSQDIAEYSNFLFYNGELQVGTDESRLCRPERAKGSIEWRHVAGEISRGAGQKSCWCRQEIDEVVALVRELLIKAKFSGTIGVVTPFREQATRIMDSLEISDIDSALWRNAELHVDTAHGFQGDERDVMIFSLCAGENLPRGSLNFLRENANLFNVAVSRARAMLYIVGNKDWAAHCKISHIEALAVPRRHRQSKPQTTKWYPYESPYEKKLADALQDAGLDPVPQVPVGFRRLDLALRDAAYPDCRLDIEVDGSCHRDASGRRKVDDLWRTLELQAQGWRVIRFWTYQLDEDLPGCVDRVQEVWNEMRGLDCSEGEE